MQKRRLTLAPFFLAALLVLVAHGLGKVSKVYQTELVLAEAKRFADVSPASGGEAAASEGDGGEAAAGEGEAAPEVDGGAHKPEQKKSSKGKVLSAEPELPRVMIGKQIIVTSKMLFEERLSTATPESLREENDLKELRKRIKPITYAHNPAWGPQTAPLVILEMTDLSCVPCMSAMKAVDEVMDDNPGKVRLINVHNPLSPSSGINLAAFYGKIAQRAGTFWAYRKSLQGMSNPTAEDYFEALIASGVDRMHARRLSQTEARRFYRELDADAMLSRQMGIGSPPQLFLNGVHVGVGGISLDKLKDVVIYENNRPRDTPSSMMVKE